MDSLERDLGDYAFAEYGDFMVPNDQWEETAAEHSERSRRAQRADAAKRAPVTTNHRVWAAAPGRWDYPGIDTPRAAPRVLPKDLMTTMAQRSSINVRTTDAPEYGSKPPVSPLGGAELYGEMGRSRAVRHGISAGTSYESDMGYDDDRYQRRREMKAKHEDTVPPEVRGPEQYSRATAGDDPRDDITWHYEEAGVGGRMSLERYGQRVRRKKREMGGLADDWAAAALVNEDLGLLEYD